MLLSTSSSEAARRSLAVLLLLLAAIFAAVEVFARFVVDRASNVEVMVQREHQEAVAIRRAGEGDASRQLLVVGNSLVGMDLDFPRLARSLGPDWQAHRYWLYNTSYDDWYFGLKRLFADGSRPDAVAVTLAPLSVYHTGIRGDYSSFYLFRPADMRAIAAEADLDKTQVSGLLLARYSRFYGLRSEIRKVLLQRILPDLPRMNELFHRGTGKALSGNEVGAVVAPRLAKLRQLIESNGAQMVLIFPPMPKAELEYRDEMVAAAQSAGVPLLMPVSGADVPAATFIDNIHLSPAGAELYTATLAPVLQAALVRSKPSPVMVQASNSNRNDSQAPVVSRPLALPVQSIP
ncbi:MAG TPA: hypothetical protein VH477_18895 [Bryobacteraceae bacterium]